MVNYGRLKIQLFTVRMCAINKGSELGFNGQLIYNAIWREILPIYLYFQ